METVREEIVELFKRNPGKEFTTNQLASRFRVSRAYVSTCIRFAKKQLTILETKEDGVTYYSTPKGQAAK